MSALTFVDLFAGCGGFSLGFLQAGLEGRFAVERDSMAFETYQRNLVSSEHESLAPFRWDERIPLANHDIIEFIKKYRDELRSMAGSIDVVCGGPPCQGFSLSGKRDPNDPRNRLVLSYLEFVDLVRPKLVVIENVPAMRHALKGGEPGDNPLFQQVIDDLKAMGFEAESRIIDAKFAGVPQERNRLFLVGVNTKDYELDVTPAAIFEAYEQLAHEQLKSFCSVGHVTAGLAISDLEERGEIAARRDSLSGRAYRAVVHPGIDRTNPYQIEMNDGVPEMDSMRLVSHVEKTVERYKDIQKMCTPGRPITISEREKLGIKKFRTHFLAADKPSPTLTTIPDDIIHYNAPRVLTVRESARLQSFPDWFQFRGKYSTGGAKRANECPRYTQVGNAVAPLVSRALAKAIRKELTSSR